MPKQNNTGRVLTEHVIDEVSLPRRWLKAEDVDSRNFHNSYPHVNSQSGCLLIYEWAHEQQEVSVSLGLIAGEDEGFGVEVTTSSGLYHAHSSASLEGGIALVECCMYMLNHSYSANNLEDKVAKLKKENDEIREQNTAHKKRAEQLASKNEMLRSQMNTLVETMSCGYDEGNWHGLITRPQKWRPPTYEETKRLALHLDRYWFDKDPDSIEDIREGTKNEIQNAFIIVLEDWNSVVTGVEDKLLFFQDKVDGLFGAFLFNEDGEGLKEVQQRPEMLSEDPQGEVVVRFDNDS